MTTSVRDLQRPLVATGAPRAPALELTILMPCLNEAETLATCIRKARGFLGRAGVAGEVVIADNGSTDGSQEIADARGRARRRRPGTGLRRRADRRHRGGARPLRHHGRRRRQLRLRHLDAVRRAAARRRRAGDGQPLPGRHRSRARCRCCTATSATRCCRSSAGCSSASRCGDFHCGLRGFRRDAMLALGLQTPGHGVRQRDGGQGGAARAADQRGADHALRPDGRSRPPHLRTWRDGWRHLRFLLLFSPRWLFLYPGLALMLLGLSAMALLSRGSVRLPPSLELDIHTMVASCFAILIGVQLRVFGALARRYAMVEGFLRPRRRRPSCWG